MNSRGAPREHVNLFTWWGDAMGGCAHPVVQAPCPRSAAPLDARRPRPACVAAARVDAAVPVNVGGVTVPVPICVNAGTVCAAVPVDVGTVTVPVADWVTAGTVLAAVPV